MRWFVVVLKRMSRSCAAVGCIAAAQAVCGADPFNEKFI